MIGTRLIEELVQSVALSHRIKHHQHVSLLLLASPESGKTTISASANSKHVAPIAVISGRSMLKEINDHPHIEFLLFNDLTAVRAMSAPAVNLLINLLNQCTQNERGIVAFAGMSREEITRPIGIIGCLPIKTFVDHRARWNELGFVSRMVPFAYHYDDELIAEIKDTIDKCDHDRARQPARRLPRVRQRSISISMTQTHVRDIRRLADRRASALGQLGIRLLKNYHALVRAHALLFNRTTVARDDVWFLRAVDEYVSIKETKPIISTAAQLRETRAHA